MTAEISLHKPESQKNVSLMIEVERKAIYGNKYFYPRNDTGSMILKLMNKKSFTLEQLKYMRSCGCEIKIIVEDISLDD